MVDIKNNDYVELNSVTQAFDHIVDRVDRIEELVTNIGKELIIRKEPRYDVTYLNCYDSKCYIMYDVDFQILLGLSNRPKEEIFGCICMFGERVDKDLIKQQGFVKAGWIHSHVWIRKCKDIESV